jgi:NAD(P)-dependent dehydrogenase (short-subunit alcohol dehydrogenase family)
LVAVTAATSGLWLAAATDLSRLGASVCLVGRDRDRTDTARRAVLAGDGKKVTTELADLGDLDQVETLAQRLTDRLHRIDTLVWLAGSPDAAPAGGRLWLDHRPRNELRLPWTWVPPARRGADGIALWEWRRRQVGLSANGRAVGTGTREDPE